jgi:hypothetical protein
MTTEAYGPYSVAISSADIYIQREHDERINQMIERLPQYLQKIEDGERA